MAKKFVNDEGKFMKRIVRLIMMIVLSIAILVLPIISNAVENSYEVFVTSSKQEVMKDEKFEVTITLDNINISTGQQGIGAYNAKVEYDNTIFDMVEIKGLENWENPEINEGEILATTKDGECINTRQDIAVVTFVAKTEISNVNSKIKVINFEASDTENTIKTDDKELEIKVNVKNVEGNQPNDNSQNNNEQRSQDKKEDDSIIKIPLPFTGRTVNINLIELLVMLIIIAIIIIVILLRKKHQSK